MLMQEWKRANWKISIIKEMYRASKFVESRNSLHKLSQFNGT